MSLRFALAILFTLTLLLLLAHYWVAGAFTGFAFVLLALLTPDKQRADARRRNPRPRHMAHPIRDYRTDSRTLDSPGYER